MTPRPDDSERDRTTGRPSEKGRAEGKLTSVGCGWDAWGSIESVTVNHGQDNHRLLIYPICSGKLPYPLGNSKTRGFVVFGRFAHRAGQSPGNRSPDSGPHVLVEQVLPRHH